MNGNGVATEGIELWKSKRMKYLLLSSILLNDDSFASGLLLVYSVVSLNFSFCFVWMWILAEGFEIEYRIYIFIDLPWFSSVCVCVCLFACLCNFLLVFLYCSVLFCFKFCWRWCCSWSSMHKFWWADWCYFEFLSQQMQANTNSCDCMAHCPHWSRPWMMLLVCKTQLLHWFDNVIHRR